MRLLGLLLVPAMAIQWNTGWFHWKRPPPNPQVDPATLAYVSTSSTPEVNDTAVLAIL